MTNEQTGYVSAFLVMMAGALLAVCLGLGCGRAARPDVAAGAPERAVVGVTDPCADRLHELSGKLLLHYGMHGELPERLEMLTDDPGLLECPVSGESYVYAPEEMERGGLVVYDVVPVHEGQRWGVVIEAGRPFDPMAARVIEVTEEMVGR